MDKKTIFRWRVNYVISYEKPNYAHMYREICLQTLKNVALLNKIYCAIKVEYPFYDEKYFEEFPDAIGLSADLVYFRASPQTKLSAREFRRMIDSIFQEFGFLEPVAIGSQDYKSLKDYPFPKESENLILMFSN